MADKPIAPPDGPEYPRGTESQPEGAPLDPIEITATAANLGAPVELFPGGPTALFPSPPTAPLPADHTDRARR